MTVFDDLIADPFAEKRYLAALEPYDPAPGRTTALHVGDHGFATGPDDDPPNRYFEPRLVSALNFERRMFRGGRLGGRSIPGYGALELNNADGGIDAWAGYAFDGRRVRVWLGGAGFAFADYGLVFDGAAEGIEFDDTVARIPLRDGRRRFQRPIQASVYAGTGAMEGGDALKGKPKPLVFGRAFAVEPVPVDPARLVYQVHDGPIEDIDACRDRGLALDRTASSPEAGEFSVDKAAGTLTLGAAPAGTLTADVRGDKAGGAYVETAGALIRRIAVARGGLADPDDLDAASFAALEAAATAPVGVHVRAETEIQAVFDTLIEAAGGHYGFDRAGRLAVGRLDAPSAAVAARFGAAENTGPRTRARRAADLAPADRLPPLPPPAFGRRDGGRGRGGGPGRPRGGVPAGGGGAGGDAHGPPAGGGRPPRHRARAQGRRGGGGVPPARPVRDAPRPAAGAGQDAALRARTRPERFGLLAPPTGFPPAAPSSSSAWSRTAPSTRSSSTFGADAGPPRLPTQGRTLHGRHADRLSQLRRRRRAVGRALDGRAAAGEPGRAPALAARPPPAPPRRPTRGSRSTSAVRGRSPSSPCCATT